MDVEFAYAGDMPFNGDTWTVGQCSVCGALVLDSGTAERLHKESHAVLGKLADVAHRFTVAAETGSQSRTTKSYVEEFLAILQDLGGQS